MIDFSFAIQDRGIFESRIRKGYCNPAKHGSVADIVDTLTHEWIHFVLDREFGTTEQQDHWLLDRLGFIDDWLLQE